VREWPRRCASAGGARTAFKRTNRNRTGSVERVAFRASVARNKAGSAFVFYSSAFVHTNESMLDCHSTAEIAQLIQDPCNATTLAINSIIYGFASDFEALNKQRNKKKTHGKNKPSNRRKLKYCLCKQRTRR
jgi:hypothetical protein